MTDTKTVDLSPLLPLRHPQHDLFVCDIFDATPKSDIASMEHPLFSLSTRPDFTVKEYRHGEKYLNIHPSKEGCATVHDRDILIYCISQLMAAVKQGRKASRVLKIQAKDLMQTTNRATTGGGYKLLKKALSRLKGTVMETNITSGGMTRADEFSLVDRVEFIRDKEGRMTELQITLSDWVFNAIKEKGGDLLTLSRDYFRLRKPLERRLYEIARKHCGQKNDEWRFKIETLHEKTGSRSTLAEFRRMLVKIIDENAEHEHIPDYTFTRDGDVVYIRPKPEFQALFNRPTPATDVDRAIDAIRLKPQTYENAKKHAGGWDIYGIVEQEWRRMLKATESVPDSPDGSFVGFVKWYVKQNGIAPR